MNIQQWPPKYRLIGAVWACLAIGCLAYAVISDIAWFSSEFYSLLAVVAILIGLALTPSFVFRPLRASLGAEMERPLKIAFGFFCAFQLAAILRHIAG